MHNAYRGGTPDVWYSGGGGDLWVEYKWLARVPKKGVDPRKLLSPLQVDWVTKRHAEGRAVLVAVGWPGGVFVFNGKLDMHYMVTLEGWVDLVEGRCL